MFNKRYLMVYITEETIAAAQLDLGIIVDEPIADLLRLIIIKQDCNKNAYEQKEVLIALMRYCVSKLDMKFMDRLTVVLIIPLEFYSIYHHHIDDYIYTVKQIESIWFFENVISAAASFLKQTVTDYKRKFMIYGEHKKTYISLLWAGAIVDFICIEKTLMDITNEDLLYSIDTISRKIAGDIPAQFISNPLINQFGAAWYEAIDNNVYVIAPDKMQVVWGDRINEYKLIYLHYEKNIVIKGGEDILKVLLKRS